MGVSADEARRLTWWEYQARVWGWNARHSNDDDEPVELPDPDFFRRRGEMLAERGITSGSIH